MEVFLNELSVIDCAEETLTGIERISFLLKMMKHLRSEGVSVLRIYESFYIEDLGGGYSITNFFSDNSVSQEMKLLLQSILTYPVIRDEDDAEVDSFIDNIFECENHKGELKTTEGIAGGHLYACPVVSLSTIAYWSSDFLEVRLTYPNGEISRSKVSNFGVENYSSNPYFKNQRSVLASIPKIVDSKSLYSIFPNDKFFFEDQAVDDILSWIRDDNRYLTKIIQLIEDISSNPFEGGLGKTEVLKHNWKGSCSKRIVKKDRLIYTYSEKLITIHRCREHY